MNPDEIRSETAVQALKLERGRLWPMLRWIHRRRPLLTAILVLLAPLLAVRQEVIPTDLLVPRADPIFLIPWALMLFGVTVRLWGSGNLRKNQEITRSGIYVLVRHPLYLGSLSVFFAYFLAIGDPITGMILFGILLGFVYYPTMLGEEEYLQLKFPGQFARGHAPPRLLPDLRRLPEALRTDRFEVAAAYRNLGFRSFWVLLILPLVLRIFGRVIG